MNRTAHKNFAVNVLKAISSSDYDDFNAQNERRNAAIREARAEWDSLPLFTAERDAAGVVLDSVLSTTLADFR